MDVKYEEDWSETTSYIAENMTISFKHEYRRPSLTSRCDVINIKTTFSETICNDLSISDVKNNLSSLLRNFQNGRHFEVRARF